MRIQVQISTMAVVEHAQHRSTHRRVMNHLGLDVEVGYLDIGGVVEADANVSKHCVISTAVAIGVDLNTVHSDVVRIAHNYRIVCIDNFDVANPAIEGPLHCNAIVPSFF